MSKEQEGTSGVSRRSFLKLGAMASATLGAASLLGTAEPEEAVAKTWDSVDALMGIDPSQFERFESKNTAFNRAALIAQGLMPQDESDYQPMLDQFNGTLKEAPFKAGDPGYTQIDYAYMAAGTSTYKCLGSSNTGSGKSYDTCRHMKLPNGKLVPLSLFAQTSESFPNGGEGCFDVAKEKYQFDSPSQAAYAVKKAARKLGADLVGIASYDERFVYKTEVAMPMDIEGNLIKEKLDIDRPVDFGFTPKSVIVLAFEMDYESFKCSGTTIENGATMMGYSRMAEVSFRLSVFLRNLGYQTYHCGNNASPSVAEGIRAGLGEGSRMSCLVTEEYGPRVRLAKVYTDCEFEYDKPKTFGVTEFCEVCQLCADSCPSAAITHAKIDDPENKPVGLCAQKGVRKYQLDAEKCLANWYMPLNGNDCGICIGVCPYNKPQLWHHDMIKIVTRIPGLNSLCRYFDGFFGYGGIPDEQTLIDFWKKDI